MKDEAFNWLAVLKDLAAGAPLNQEERGRLKFKAMYWPECACGQLCQDIPKNYFGIPIDDELRIMGSQFAGAIGTEDWKEAIAIFHQIEERTAEVWKQIYGTTSLQTNGTKVRVSLCACGHTGDAPKTDHHDETVAGVTLPGHGICKKCKCLKFTWKGWKA